MSKQPARSAMRRAFLRDPSRPNTEWAREWGISRERVRQIREKLGLEPVSTYQAREREQIREQQEQERQKLEAAFSDRECPICGNKVPALRKRTCSSPCAQKWRGNSKYRFRANAR